MLHRMLFKCYTVNPVCKHCLDMQIVLTPMIFSTGEYCNIPTCFAHMLDINMFYGCHLKALELGVN